LILGLGGIKLTGVLNGNLVYIGLITGLTAGKFGA